MMSMIGATMAALLVAAGSGAELEFERVRVGEGT